LDDREVPTIVNDLDNPVIDMSEDEAWQILESHIVGRLAANAACGSLPPGLVGDVSAADNPRVLSRCDLKKS
jgi:hypothetical protein